MSVLSFSDYTPAARFDAIPWSDVRIEEGTTSVGPWTAIDTITLSPLDTDPANPQARNITITDASSTAGLWYRLTFIDGNGGEGQPSEPIQNETSATQFATAFDFATRVGITLTDDETARVDALLSAASALIQDEVRQQIALVTDDTLTMTGTTDERIVLPERPVVSVASVAINGQVLAQGTDYYLDADEIVKMGGTTVMTSAGLDALLDWPASRFSGFGWPNQTLEIVYTHGFDTIPGIVKAICLEAVVRVWVNPGSVARETAGNTATVYDNMRFSPTGLLLTEKEQSRLRKKFGTKAKSITIGG